MKSKSVKNSLTLMCLMIVLVSVIVIGGISISNISTMTSTANLELRFHIFQGI